MKTCIRCQELKPLSDYHKQSSKPDGHRSVCKSCRLSESATYYTHNREIVKRKWKEYLIAHPNYNQGYYRSNPQYFEQYRKEHSDRYKIWRQSNKKHLTAYRNQLKKKDPNFKVACSLRSCISVLIRNSGVKKKVRSTDLLGCSIDDFRQHLERQFSEGMSWNNYGEWHIDHIIPCSSFDLTKIENQRKCFNHTNQRPLWAIDNLRKGNRQEPKTLS